MEIGIVPEVWGPFHGIEEANITQLDLIGAKYHKSWAQVLLRFHLDHGVTVIPKSHNK